MNEDHKGPERHRIKRRRRPHSTGPAKPPPGRSAAARRRRFRPPAPVLHRPPAAPPGQAAPRPHSLVFRRSRQLPRLQTHHLLRQVEPPPRSPQGVRRNPPEEHLLLERSAHRVRAPEQIRQRPEAVFVVGVLLLGGRQARFLHRIVEVHCFVLRNGFDSDIFVANALVTFYARCDEAGSARIVFDRMPERDIVSWNSMIAGYSQCGYYRECKELYREMVESGLRPNGVTVVSVLQACGQSQDLIFGMDVHKLVIDCQVQVDISLYNALIGCYAKCGSLDYARELFEEMDEKDEVTYGAIVSGYMVHGFVDKAMGIFQGMKCPGLSTWNAVISGLVQNNHHGEVLDLFREMLDSGTRPNTVTLSSILPTCSFFSTAIIDTYAKSGFINGAQQVFDRLKGSSLIVWTAIISAYAAHGDAITALGLFDNMQTRGIQPDPVTITAVLSACSHNGLVDVAWKIFNEMLPNYGIEPLVEHYACMVGVLSRAKRLSEAAEFIRMMPIQPSAKVWGALLNGASVSGDVELGKFACDHLFEIEPENTGNYVIMANLYSQAGRWEEADRVRGKMKNIGLKKIAGNSWIEMDGGLKSFIARDASSDKHEEIYEVLEGLLGPLREEGYVYKEEMDEESLHV
ncbi:hypothetical protein EUGRSUZ_A01207 [Eucalyptus grandis]|uniref:Uncharacterized protein n=2 Tax=Eucalyptus grandis TaxID=71139 RepID=A0ACC3M283_EUCGR|nr:hypothetical protein EUGRSUZ_A01207 [Eucalyptus grandis]